MSVHTFEPEVFYNTFGPHAHALRIADGDTVITKTLDALGFDEHGEQIGGRGNPLTGPFYVEGAEPGDTLAVEIVRAHPHPDCKTGVANARIVSLTVNPDYVQTLPDYGPPWEWRINHAARTTTLVDDSTALGGSFTLPLEPMLGCIGVAPPLGQAISSATSGTYGGNMDYAGFRAGVTAYFPVYEPGALLFVGDGHSVQGDGEIVGMGVETAFEVELAVRVIKDKAIGWPRGEDADFIFTAGNARPLLEALQHATTEMLKWLQEDGYRFDRRGANILLGQCVKYDIGNVIDPAFTVACRLAKKYLPGG
jgi:acetamidase/formamidase